MAKPTFDNFTLNDNCGLLLQRFDVAQSSTVHDQWSAGDFALAVKRINTLLPNTITSYGLLDPYLAEQQIRAAT